MADAHRGFSVFELRPLNVADLLDAAIRIYRRRFVPLLSICAVIAVPLGVLQVVATTSLFSGALGDPTGEMLPNLSMPIIIALGLYGVLFWITMPLMQAAVAKAVAEFYLGTEAGVASAYRFALRKWLTLLAIMFLVAMLTSGIAIVAMIPVGVMMGALGPEALLGRGENLVFTLSIVAIGLVMLLVALVAVLYFSLKLYFGGLVAVLEDTGAIVALQRSWRLSDGHMLRVLVTISVLWLMIVFARGIVTWPAQLGFVFLGEQMAGVVYAVVQALSVLMQVLTQPLLVTGTVLLYYDLRIRKEGFDLTAMAEAIGAPEPAARTRRHTFSTALFTATGDQASQSEEADEPQDQHPVP